MRCEYWDQLIFRDQAFIFKFKSENIGYRDQPLKINDTKGPTWELFAATTQRMTEPAHKKENNLEGIKT